MVSEKDFSNVPTYQYYKHEITNCKGEKFIFNEEYSFIYSLINKKNGKRYIGKTVNPKARLLSHFHGIQGGYHPNKSILADRDDGFEYEILESKIEYPESADREKFYMIKFKTYDPRFGYNMNDHRFKNGECLTKLGRELIQ